MTKKKAKKRSKIVEMMWPTMSRKRFLELGQYVRDRADNLGLRDWTLELRHVALDPDDDALACVVTTYGRRFAMITLGYNFATEKPEIQRHTIVHELLHIWFDQVERPVRDGGAVWQLIGKPAGLVLFNEVRDAVEHGVDAIAAAIAGGFPLP